MRLTVEPGDPRAPAARALLEESQALMRALYAPQDNHALPLDALAAPDVDFFVARRGAEVLGTAALAPGAGYGEVKAMFVVPAARGQGVGAALLRQIEDQARARGLTCLRLETGPELDAALALYRRHGFTPCPPFGGYAASPASLFLEKPLPAAADVSGAAE